MRAAALALLALLLAGCQSTQEKSAQLERAAKEHPGAAAPRSHGLTITHQSRLVQITSASVLHSAEGTAAVLTLRNTASRALRDIPIEIDVHDAAGASIYTNTAPGLGHALVSAPVLAAHGSLTWVDDQIQPAGVPAGVRATIGEAPPAGGSIPVLSVTATHVIEGPGAEGTVVNRSGVEQRELVVYCVARSGAKVVAAGRAVVPQLAAHASARFQLFFIGQPAGARLEFSAPPTSLG